MKKQKIKNYLEQIKKDKHIGMFVNFEKEILNNSKIFYKILKFDSQILGFITNNKLKKRKKTIKYLLKLKTNYNEEKQKYNKLYRTFDLTFLDNKILNNEKIMKNFMKKNVYSTYIILPIKLKNKKSFFYMLINKVKKDKNILSFFLYDYIQIPQKFKHNKKIKKLLKSFFLNIDYVKNFYQNKDTKITLKDLYINLSKKNRNNINIIINILKTNPSLLDFILLNSNINKDKLFKQLRLLNIYEPFLFHKFNYKNYKIKTLLYILEKEPKLFRKLPLKYQKNKLIINKVLTLLKKQDNIIIKTIDK